MFEGTTTALITPFLENGEVDYEGYRKNVRFQIKNGINGLMPLGTTGESPTLEENEKEEILKLVVEESGGKIPVIVGTGTNSTKKSIAATRKAEELGADAALVVMPYYNKPTPNGVYEHFRAIAESIDISIIVYNIAGRTGRNIDTPTMKRLAGIKNIAGVKEASGDINQMGDVIREIALKNPDFNVLSGDDGMTFPLMALGGKGVISVVSNLVPDRVVALTTAALAGDFETARDIHFELLPLFKVAFIETNPIPIKAAMNMKGFAGGFYRLPMCEMEDTNKEKLRNVLQEMKII